MSPGKRYITPLLPLGMNSPVRWMLSLLMGSAVAAAYLYLAGTGRESLRLASIMFLGISVLSLLILNCPVGVYILRFDRLVDRCNYPRPHEYPFENVSSILTTPCKTGGLQTHVSLGVWDQIPPALRQEGGYSGLLRLVRRMTESAGQSAVISSRTGGYTELIAEIVSHSDRALVDPFTRLIADFASLAPIAHPSAVGSYYSPPLRGQDDLESAKTSLSRFNLRKAEPLLRRAAEEDASNGEALVLLGKACLLTRRMESAEKALDMAVAVRPKDADARFYLGVARYYNEEFVEALGDFRAATGLRPGDPLIMSFLGCTSRRIREWEEAQSAILRMEKHPCMQKAAMKCLGCLAQSREAIKTGKTHAPGSRAMWVRAVLAILGLLGVLEQFLKELLKDRLGTLGFILGIALIGGAALAHYIIQHATGKGEVPGTCWFSSGWMKHDDFHVIGTPGEIERQVG